MNRKHYYGTCIGSNTSDVTSSYLSDTLESDTLKRRMQLWIKRSAFWKYSVQTTFCKSTGTSVLSGFFVDLAKASSLISTSCEKMVIRRPVLTPRRLKIVRLQGKLYNVHMSSDLNFSGQSKLI